MIDSNSERVNGRVQELITRNIRVSLVIHSTVAKCQVTHKDERWAITGSFSYNHSWSVNS